MWSVLNAWSSWIITSFLAISVTLILYETSHRFRYCFKFALYVLICSVTGLFVIIPVSLVRKPRDVENVLYGTPICRLVCPLVGIQWEVTGKEHLSEQRSAVVVSNHQSAWDFSLILELWSTMQRCACVAKRAIMWVFPFGFASWLCGTVFIDRSNAKDSRTKISATAEDIKTNKTKMWIFPEGTRSKREELLPFKKGAFHIAVQHRLPIIPVVISPYTFINDEKMIFNSGKVLVTVLPAVETTDVEDVNKLTEEVRDLMNEEYKRLTAQVMKEAGEKAVNNLASNASNGHAEPVGFENGKRRS